MRSLSTRKAMYSQIAVRYSGCVRENRPAFSSKVTSASARAASPLSMPAATASFSIAATQVESAAACAAIVKPARIAAVSDPALIQRDKRDIGTSRLHPSWPARPRTRLARPRIDHPSLRHARQEFPQSPALRLPENDRRLPLLDDGAMIHEHGP